MNKNKAFAINMILMENVDINLVYKRIISIEKKLDKMGDLLQIPLEIIPDSELKTHMARVKRMKDGKEGISLADYKREAGLR